MKYFKNIFFISLAIYSNVGVTNEMFDRAEENHNFYSPIKTVDMIVKSRGNRKNFNPYIIDNKKLEQRLHNVFRKVNIANLAEAYQFQFCKYKDGKRTLVVEFRKNKNRWRLIRVLNNKRNPLSIKSINKKIYKLNESNNCFPDFVKYWEKKHRGSRLKLINEEAKVDNVLLKISGIPYKASFNFKYIYPNRVSYKNGWLISSLLLNKINRGSIDNRPLPANEQSFFAPDVLTQAEMLSATSKQLTNQTEKSTIKKGSVNEITCHDNEGAKKIRVTFNLKSNIKAQSTMISSSNGSRIITFALSIDRAKINLNNCIYLVIHNENELMSIDLTKLPKKIKGVKYGSGRRKNTSFIDYYY